MKEKFKKLVLLSSMPLLLVACTNVPEEVVEDEVMEDKVEISNVQVDVTTAITEAVEKIDGSVVSVLNLQRNNFNSWASFYGESTNEEEYLQAGSGSERFIKFQMTLLIFLQTIM